MPVESEAERRSWQRIGQLWLAVRNCAHQSDLSEKRSRQARERLERLEGNNPDLKDVSLQRGIDYFLLDIGLFAIYFLDMIVFSATAEFLAHLAFPSLPWMAEVARFAVPAFILATELAIAAQIHLTHEEAVDLYDGLRRPHWKWIALGTMMALVMALMVIATNLASRPPVLTPALERSLQWQLAGLIALVLATHLTVLLGGRWAHEAKAYPIFKVRQGLLNWRIRRLDSRSDRATRAAARAFSIYSQRLSEHRGNFPGSSRVSRPLDAVTQRVLSRQFEDTPPDAPGEQNDGHSPTSPDGPEPPVAPEGTPAEENGQAGHPEEGRDRREEDLLNLLDEQIASQNRGL